MNNSESKQRMYGVSPEYQGAAEANDSVQIFTPDTREVKKDVRSLLPELADMGESVCQHTDLEDK